MINVLIWEGMALMKQLEINNFENACQIVRINLRTCIPNGKYRSDDRYILPSFISLVDTIVILVSLLIPVVSLSAKYIYIYILQS